MPTGSNARWLPPIAPEQVSRHPCNASGPKDVRIAKKLARQLNPGATGGTNSQMPVKCAEPRLGGWNGAKMFVLRYFGYVGGTLLALLFVTDAMLPKQPLPGVLKSGSDLPAVRIHSDKKWPERVVFDTSTQPVAPVVMAEAAAAPRPVVASAPEATAKARVREAFAQFSPAEPKATAAAPKMAAAEPKSAAPKPAQVIKRKVARVHPIHPSRPVMLAAQQRFGWFDNTW